MPLDKKIDFRCTELQKKIYKAFGGAKFLRDILDNLEYPDEIIYQKDGKLLKKINK